MQPTVFRALTRRLRRHARRRALRVAARQAKRGKSDSKRHAAFTLLQLGLILALFSGLAAVLLPAFSRAKANANRQSCDVKLKGITLALDAFQSERGAYPATLMRLVTDGYLTQADALRCPSEPDETGTYNDGYLIRAPGDGGASPVVVCHSHEDRGGGNQARLGRFTTQFATRPATLTSGQAVQIRRPGQSAPVEGVAGTSLRGGDRLSIGGAGAALVTFADGSSAKLQNGAEIEILQSFVDGHSGAPLYTLVRQTRGAATYSVRTGNRFDVATPAATAGARGTRFRLEVGGNRPQDTRLFAMEGKVVLTTPARSGLAPLGGWVSATAEDARNLLRSLF